jgi:copper chaperone
MQKHFRTELPLIPTDQSGCSCCSTAASTSTASTSTGTEYSIEGLSCGHCVETIETAVSKIDGLQSASVELVPGGTSRLMVIGTAAEAAVRDAVAAAGYSFTISK